LRRLHARLRSRDSPRRPCSMPRVQALGRRREPRALRKHPRGRPGRCASPYPYPARHLVGDDALLDGFAQRHGLRQLLRAHLQLPAEQQRRHVRHRRKLWVALRAARTRLSGAAIGRDPSSADSQFGSHASHCPERQSPVSGRRGGQTGSGARPVPCRPRHSCVCPAQGHGRAPCHWDCRNARSRPA